MIHSTVASSRISPSFTSTPTIGIFNVTTNNTNTTLASEEPKIVYKVDRPRLGLVHYAHANPPHVALPIEAPPVQQLVTAVESSASGKNKKNNEPQMTQTPTMRTLQPELDELRTPPVDENDPVVKSAKVAMQNSTNAEQTPASSPVATESPNGLYEAEKPHQIMDDNNWEFNESALRPNDKFINQPNAVSIKPKKIRLGTFVEIWPPHHSRGQPHRNRTAVAVENSQPVYGQPTFEDSLLEISLSAEDGKKNEKVGVKTEKTEVGTTRDAPKQKQKRHDSIM